jgi:hypothetical protein
VPWSDWQPGVESTSSPDYLVYSNETDDWSTHAGNTTLRAQVARAFGFEVGSFNADLGAANCAWHQMQVIGNSGPGSHLVVNYSGACPTPATGTDGNAAGSSPAYMGYRYTYSHSGVPLSLADEHIYGAGVGHGDVNGPIALSYNSNYFHPYPPTLPPAATDYEYQSGPLYATLVELTIFVDTAYVTGYTMDQPLNVYLTQPGGDLTGGWLTDGYYGEIYGPDTFQGVYLGQVSGEGTETFVLDEATLANYLDGDGWIREFWIYLVVPALMDASPGLTAPSDADYWEEHLAPATRVRISTVWRSPPWRYYTAAIYGWGIPIAGAA